MLDEGYIIDGYGERVDCKNLILVFTSNAASREILSWVDEENINLEEKVRNFVIDKSIFSPEFLNRFDKVLVFQPIGLKTAYEIGYKITKAILQEYIEQQKIEIKVTDTELREWIEDAYKVENGVREIDRVIRENLADKASETLLT